MAQLNDLTITLVQTELFWEDRKKNLENLSGKILSVEYSDLIILPEMFSTGFTMNSVECAESMDGNTIQWMKEMAAKKNCVVTGSLIIREGNNFFNRLIWMQSDGTFDCYDKRHLFRMAGEQEHYTAGDKKLIAELKGWKIMPLVCYDLRFPVWSRNKRTEGLDMEYDLLIYVANWPERRSHAWNTLLLSRAIENLAYVAGVNRIGTDGNRVEYSGNSAVINFKGDYQAQAEPSKNSVISTSLSYSGLSDFRASFPAHLDADNFILT